MRVALLGGSGFVGSALRAALQARGDDVVTISLRDPGAAASAAAGCDAIVNLAGEPIAQRWNTNVKARILESRTEAPRAFLNALATLPHRASTYASASGIDYYGTSRDAIFDESSAPGDTFLAHVCVQWEETAHRAAALGMRVACVRTGLALGHGGLLTKVLPIFRAGLGGRIGDGREWYSWVHIDDLVGIYLLAIDGTDGAINAVAPNPVTNEQFTQALSRVLHRRAALPVPAFAVRAALGEGADALLERQRVVPKRALELGYAFRFPTLDAALGDLVR